MSARILGFLTFCAALLAVAGCEGVPRTVKEAPGASASSCTGCHGDATRAEATPLLKAAPPVATAGHSPGAHAAHLHDGAFRAAVACTECHVVPSSTAHVNGTAALTFGALASSGGATPAWRAATATCTVYCHGATLGGGPAASPAWSSAAVLDCGSCHGAPPPAPHPANAACSSCHPGTVDASRTILVTNGLHINGVVDVGTAHSPGWQSPDAHGHAANTELNGCKACHGDDFAGGTSGVSCNDCHGGTAWQTNCTFCHGTPGRAGGYAAAPPVGTQGETASTDRAVGAHLAHLAGGGVGPAVACTECHTVPADLSHVDGTPEVTLGALASRGGTSPAWNPGSLGCSATYCHGATLGGGTNTAPTWTGGASQTACGTCHGLPPPSPHPAASACGTCHAGYTASTVNAAVHLDGTVQVTDPHPDPDWSNPTHHGYGANASLASCKNCHGADLLGGTTGVSCDSCHGGAGWRTNCTFCHGTAGRGGGYDAAPPVGTQGQTATSDRAVGAHQAHLAGGGVGPAVACTECHAVPADIAHVNGTAAVSLGALSRRDGASPSWDSTGLTCATYCHGATLGGGSDTTPTWTGGAAQASCGTCHGLPPPAPHSTSTNCGGCHTGYTSTTVNAALHLDGTVQATGGHAAGYAAKEQHGYQASRDGLTGCKGCHGADLSGGTGPSCNSCHPGATPTAWQTDCTFCHGTPGGLASPPVDTQGQSVRSQVSVGAHAKHMALSWMTASSVTCNVCHGTARGNVVTDTAHMNGRPAEVTFTGVAAQGTASTFTRTSDTAATCATYCHGRFTGGATSASPSWVSTTAMTCTSCHGAPPSTGRHQANSSHRTCANCHSGYTSTGVNVSTHVNGTKEVGGSGTRITSWNASTRTCTSSCHGQQTW